jgi:acyl dehydratase
MTGGSPAYRHYYDDVIVDETVVLGKARITREEIVAYAATFDPQPLHLDEEAAKASRIGRLCASGWHSCAILMRLLCDGYLLEAASLGSPGMEEVRFIKPVFPDTTLVGRFRCTEKRLLRSRPGIGLARLFFELTDEAGDVLLTWDTSQLMKLRAPPAAAAH